MNHSKSELGLFILLFFLSISLGKGQCDRQLVIQDYNEVYLTTFFDTEELNWSGNFQNCDEGAYSSTVSQKLIDRINYFRRLCSLNDDVTFESEKNILSQASAFMQEVNGSLSHCNGENGAPCDTWSCNSESAITGSQAANLSWASWDVYDPIDLYIADFGSGNQAVGHRRWILYSKAKTFGCGMTNNRNAIYVFGNGGNAYGNIKDYIAYPPSDYIVQDLVYPRWSFGIPGADFTQANVQMVDENGYPVDLNIVYNASVSFGDYSIVWEPEGIITDDIYDKEYHVNISNIQNAPQSNYSYTVTIVPNFHPPICDDNKVWNEENCQCEDEVDCPEDLVLNDSPIEGTFGANNTIMSKGKVMWQDTAQFGSGNGVFLDMGFEVYAGAEFDAMISSNPCADLISTPPNVSYLEKPKTEENFTKLSIPLREKN